MAGAISTLLEAGFDSFSNLYDVIITWPTGAGTDPGTTTLAVRAKDFSFTPLTVQTYPVTYKTSQITRPGAFFTGERSFTLAFRNDSSYNLLQSFHTWKHLYADPSGETHINFGAMSTNSGTGGNPNSGNPGGNFAGSKATDDIINYGKILVKGLKSVPGATTGTSDSVTGVANAESTNRTGAFWAFESVMAIDITEPTYTRESSNPVEFTVKFLYGRMAEPGGRHDGVVAAVPTTTTQEIANNRMIV